MKKNILICGASGFIGRNMAEAFARLTDVEVYGTYRKSPEPRIENVKLLQADLTNKEDVERAVKGKDIIIQAAATTSGAKDIVTKPYLHVTDNAIMNSLIFRSAFEQGVQQVVFFSCTVMYQSSETPVKESDFNANVELFPSYFGVGWTKVYIEKLCEFYSRQGKTKFTVIRHSNMYGPHDKFDLERSHVFGATMTKVMTTPEPGDICVWGSGEERRDLLYISDLVDFVSCALQKQETLFELFNVGLGESISVKQLVEEMIRVSGRKLGITFDTTKPTIKTKLCLDTSKAFRLLGWRPRVSLREGIEKTLQWYKAHYLS